MFGYEAPKTKATMAARIERDHPGLILTRKNSRLIARNTLVYETGDGTRIVRYHETDVVTIDPKGVVTLDSGGYQTPTTKGRMNDATPSGWYVSQDRGLWHVRTPKGSFPFTDGARFKADGSPFNAASLARNVKKQESERKLVAAFLKHARENGWADPAGDPWIFSEPTREVAMDWIESKYFTRKLAELALSVRFQPAGVYLYLSDMERRGGKPDKYVCGVIRRYIYRILGLPS